MAANLHLTDDMAELTQFAKKIKSEQCGIVTTYFFDLG